MPTYEDFTIRIGPRRGDGYAVTVAESPGGTGSGILRLPFDLKHLGPLRETVGFQIRGDVECDDVERDMDTSSAWRPDGDDGIGHALFEGLFSGDVLSLFDQSLGRASERNSVLRIKLALDVEDSELAPLASLPWELIYRQKTREYLATSRASTIVRFLDVVQSNQTRPYAPPLRVLLVTANPNGDLDLRNETLRIREALESAPGFALDFLEDATYQTLEARLHEDDYHVVHFMGHGAFKDERGGLLLADGLVSGTDLGDLLRRGSETRLVLLNACSTARITSKHGHDPFAGVATALVMAGVPAVVAMQFPITDAAAIAFSERFYKGLADNRPVEDAVTGGRMAVKGLLRDKMEWATPVLFLQAAAERLFVREKPSGAGRHEGDRAPVQGAEDLSLQPYMVDRARVMDELRLAIERDFVGEDGPLVCVIHGDNEQCQAALRERLYARELPRFLGLNPRRESVKSYKLEWPREYRQASDFHDLLTWNLSDQTFGHSRGSSEAIRDHFFGRVPAVMVHSTVYSSEWSHYPPSLISDYVDYWKQWPRSPAQRLLVFLIVTYQVNPNLNWFKRRRETKQNEAIEHELLALGPDSFDGVAFRVLPRLGDVAVEDAERWAEDHGHRDLIPAIKAAYEAGDPERPPMQMEALTSILRRLLEQKFVQQAPVSP